jgi:hypothetical protein
MKSYDLVDKTATKTSAIMGHDVPLARMMADANDRLSLRALPLSGDYDKRGRYWGNVRDTRMWQISSSATGDEYVIRLPSYLDRARVKASLLAACPSLRFLR